MLDQRSSLRTLLRGHSARITDVSFFQGTGGGGSSDIVGTVGGPGDCANVLIWRIFPREDELVSEKLLEIRWEGAARIVWHPFNPNALILLVGNHVQAQQDSDSPSTWTTVATFVETTRLMTVVDEKEGHAVCNCSPAPTAVDASSDAAASSQASEIEGALKLIVPGSWDKVGINDLCWSDSDARHVLTAHRDGSVRLWDLKSRVSINAKGEEVMDGGSLDQSTVVTAKCLMVVKAASDVSNTESEETEGGVERCMFLPAYDDASAVFRSGGSTAMEPGSYLTSPFLTCTKKGACVTLWSPFTSSGSPPTKVRVFELAGPNSGTTYNVATVTLPMTAPSTDETSATPSTYILFADTTEGNIHAVHMASQWRGAPESDQSIRKMAALTGFDYVIPFKAVQPVYSWSIITVPSAEHDGKFSISLFCVQSKAVQLLTLAPNMCLAPPPLEEGGELPAGIVVEDLGAVPMTDVAVQGEGSSYDDEEYAIGSDGEQPEEGIVFDDYDHEEEEAEESEKGDFDKTDESNVTAAVHTAAIPAFLGGDDTTANSFSNWLGNLANSNKSSDISSAPNSSNSLPAPPGLEVLSKVPLPEAPMDLSSLPLPDAPVLEPEVESAPNVGSFLSPMEMLGNKSEKTKDSRGNKTPVRPAKNSDKQSHKAKQKQPVPIPSKDGKIAILKRDDNTVKKSVEEETKVSVSASPVSKEEVEGIMKRALSAHLSKQESFITAEIQKAVRYEVQSLNKTITQTVEQTLNKSFKTSLAKNVKDSLKVNTADLATSITSQISEPVVGAFHQSMREVMIPSYESATQQMFGQISASLDKGLEKQGNNDDETKKLFDGMAKRMDAMGKTIEVLIQAVAQLHTSQSPQKEINDNNVDASEVLRAKIVELLKAEDYEKAFTQALSVSDSNIALFVCKNSNLSAVLESDTPNLSQPILLCLMQQLGADLSSSESNDLKIRLEWLQNIAVTLDPFNENIRKHVPGVCRQLVDNINTKMNGGDPVLRRPLQMLLQVIRGIGNS